VFEECLNLKKFKSKINILKKINNETDKKELSVLSLALELGYIVTIPIVLCALAGRLLDKKIDSSPWFLLLGIAVSIFLSTYLVYKKTVAVMDKK
jgi:F0F1-type ATP synthase assembly protein I